MNRNDVLAFDAQSQREYTPDGQLRIKMTPISKANVCTYYGHEIPDSQALGLDPHKGYRLYRDPDELRKGASTFDGVQLLSQHVPVCAADHKPELIVGAVGSGVTFDGTFLKAPLSVWSNDAILGIERNTKRELSSAYRYRADMTPGTTPDGEPYDGVMRDIIGNHVALVTRGRAGPEVFAEDANPTEYIPMKRTPKMVAMRAALAGFASATMAADAAPLDIDKLTQGERTAEQIAQDAATQDASIDAEKLTGVLKAAEESAGQDFDEPKPADPKPETTKPTQEPTKVAEDQQPAGFAMDEATFRREMQMASDAAVKRVREEEKARNEVRPIVGEVAAMDSAEAVYKFALDSAGIPTEGVHASAFPAMVAMLNQQKTAIAQDAAPRAVSQSEQKELADIFGEGA
ncbi:DUF2213 domain-containing protein [Zymobacter sp. IVIA_12111.31 C1]|uniref:DUF2213 domain-containing protein n=1 Tax=Zymobacter sp. IVIA_12111.31 C1 TaxID=3394854 RepID=UPI0039C49852